MSAYKNWVIIICGPTAVGKTDLSLRLADLLKTEIISADSRQCYREMTIGVAKPSTDELALTRHHFINSHHIVDDVNAATFGQYALCAVDEIFTRRQSVVMVGGTGLYIKAFTEGLDEIPGVPGEVRMNIVSNYKAFGLQWLQQQVQLHDPKFWQIAEQSNPRRLMRALEVKLATNKSIVDFRKGEVTHRPFNIIKIGLEMARQTLYERINARVDTMIASGLLEEVRQLLPFRDLPALQTVGYRELFDFIDGKCTLEQAIESIKTNTRHYAKRQMTWFKKDVSITWYQAEGQQDKHIVDSIIKNIN
ncbi:tRNA (adenosine(37)-N6)-dimethylallyltransferase MiaA [Segetibacter sp. 3557_3]|uniref:tRNA (adenosine(37)-N6)-dimethylallyltransferase MiaA n=1 Tax=Segetibacter sp. 3557_3 TaxID=2547429 RepID=UPI001058BA9D|nr:tRNA (adenosine(37)-N6)-dimethylallyltransferase MiaA [Segetibacter sp. 3557_3]TDH28755.1 tRNA (adenosine(37)-N6)-dimethylallyltransferase MiaA [Segetibacter sp. 3557_3]